MCRSHTAKTWLKSESAPPVVSKHKTTLSGKGKLTDKVNKSVQNYFGQAIRQNDGTVQDEEGCCRSTLALH